MKSRAPTSTSRLLFAAASTLLLVLQTPSIHAQTSNELKFTDHILDDQCVAQPYAVPGLADEYTVGVLAIRGFPAAYREFNLTFSEYLTATAGTRFDRPIRFVMKPMNFNSLFDEIASSQVDFFYVNPSAYSCVESEYGAHSLVSQISKRKVGDTEYDLTEFGGVIFARADSDIDTIEQIKDRVVAAASISGLGSGQMQFRKLLKHGLHHLNDPSQVVFTSNQEKVVNGVLKGDFDVGFVRTDQIERTIDEETGEIVDKSLLKVISPVEGLMSDGEPFPFESSTELYSEWNVAALNHVPNRVNLAVQEALVALMDHAQVGETLAECYDTNNCEHTARALESDDDFSEDDFSEDDFSQEDDTNYEDDFTIADSFGGHDDTFGSDFVTNVTDDTTFFNIGDDNPTFVTFGDDDDGGFEMNTCMEECEATIPLPTPRCDTTPSLAKIAYAARKAGKYAGFRTTLTYMSLRDMQEETGFIRKNLSTGKMQCIRSNNLFDAVACPRGHYKKSPYDVVNGCEAAGKPCGDGFQCLCKPCVKAFEINVFLRGKDTEEACDKFSVCGQLEQGQELVFLATDNEKRDEMELTVKMHAGKVVQNIMTEKVLPEEIIKDDSVSKFVKSQATKYTHEFKVASNKVGVMMIEVLANGKQIPESPFRIMVEPRDCSVVGESRIPDIDGNCVCAHNTVEKGGDCVEPSQTKNVVVTILGALVLGFLSMFAVHRVRAIRRLQRDHQVLLNRLDEVTGSTGNFLHGEIPIKDGHKELGFGAMIKRDELIDFGVLAIFFIGFISFAHYNMSSTFIAYSTL